MKKPVIKRTIFFLVTAAFIAVNSYGQADTTALQTYESMSLKDLLDVKIVSASKKSESLFESPLSASVVTREDIRRSGATSVMEALRLVPGMIVREQTNGNYDIYLRGMDNVPPNGPFEGNSTTTLVMMNNRPIYNYLKGGTFWETLPVDINDVDKIEVIRGPAAALYGPNAVSGVINIITRQTEKDGLYLVANSQQGSNHTFINNASIGYRFNRQWSAIVSGNYQSRNRSQNDYYEIFRNQWLPARDYLIDIINDTFRNIEKVYPVPERAMEKYAGNTFISYNPGNKVRFDLAAGIQHSFVQAVSTDNGITPLTTVSSDSRYADLRAQVKGLSAQLSYNQGTQNKDYQPGNKYDFNTWDVNIEYNYTYNRFSIKPGVSYRSATYDDTKYSDTVNKTGVFNNKGSITTASTSLRAEYKLPGNKIRLVAGAMTSKFNYPDKTYLSYEFGATYKINNQHLLRVVYSSSPRSSNIFDNYIEQHRGGFPLGPNKTGQFHLESNKNLQLLTANMFEMGYRAIITPQLQWDVELFHIRSENYSTFITYATYAKVTGIDTLVIVPLRTTNIPIIILQQGATVSLTYSTEKLQVRPFITVQKTIMRNYSPYVNMPDATITGTLNTNPVINNLNSGIGNKATIKSTPPVFGGVFVNYMPAKKWNINVNSYYYAAQTYLHSTNLIFNDGIHGIDHIRSKLIVNASISFEPVQGFSIFCTGKNLLNNEAREFFKSDYIPFRLLAGIHYSF